MQSPVMDQEKATKKMNIPFLDLKRQYETIATEVDHALKAVIAKTAFAGGPFVASFEEDFAKYCETDYAIGCNSGTSALHLAMLALGIGAGDEVILPANTFVATAWGVSYVNATPVFVDCDDYWNIDPAAIEAKITDKTKAIVGVHLYGQPFDVDAVSAIAKKHNLFLLEDAAQAHGARYKGTRVGGFGEMACFSFYPGKNLGAYGEGGGISTNNAAYRDHIFSLRNHGSKQRYYHDEVGFNMRMDGFQGAILEAKLKHLDDWNARRRAVAKAYSEGITNAAVTLPKMQEFAESVFHLYIITVADKNDFIEYLKAEGISTGQHYPVPCHLQKAYADLNYQRGDFPKSEFLADHCVSLPIFAELTEEE
ncbi:MAG: DegT/DnrJ/EryC1/StrS family aminotransferase, partial [Saprospiraceae bacterium]